MMLRKMYLYFFIKLKLKYLITVLSVMSIAQEYVGNIIKANEAI